MRVTVVGYGYFGQHHVRVLRELPRVRQVRVVDVSPEARERARVAVGADELVTDQVVWEETDALIVVSPPDTHVDWVIQAVERDIPVFCEKPCGISLADCARIEEPETLVQIGYVYAYHPCFEWLQAFGHHLGRPRWAQAWRASLGPKVRHDLSVLEDYACHDISMAILLWGVPDEVSGERGVWLQPEIADAVTVSLRWARGIRSTSGLWLTAMCSWYAPDKERRWTVVGDTKMVIWDDMRIENQRLALYDSGYTRSEEDPPLFVPYERMITRLDVPWEEPLKRELAHFVAMCYGDEGIEERTGLTHARQVWSVMEAVKHNWR